MAAAAEVSEVDAVETVVVAEVNLEAVVVEDMAEVIVAVSVEVIAEASEEDAEVETAVVSVEEEAVVIEVVLVAVDHQEEDSEDVDLQEAEEDHHVVDAEEPVECEEERLSLSNHIVSVEYSS